jgi:hypothetical protein
MAARHEHQGKTDLDGDHTAFGHEGSQAGVDPEVELDDSHAQQARSHQADDFPDRL